MTVSQTIAKLYDSQLTFENCIVTPETSNLIESSFLELSAGRSNDRKFIFTLLPISKSSDPKMPDHKPNTLFVGRTHRDWAYLAVNSAYSATYRARKDYKLIDSITCVVELKNKQLEQDVSLDTDQMAAELSEKFKKHKYAISSNQPFVFKFHDTTGMERSVMLKVNELPCKEQVCWVNETTKVKFENGINSKLKLTGNSRSKRASANIINPDFNFQELGIGGLDEQFKEIFRRAFASRNLSPDAVERMGTKHVKGILLHGPPGCGKTLTARQIGKMLSVREPKIVNGPEILNKFVGESESNIRKLFEDAEDEQKRLGANSGLHIIIFDEIDAICKQRGSVQGASGVHDTVVNQLLSKIDGVEPLNNILVIGMTNRPDLIDEALMRPGRLEVKKEIGLPDEEGRLQVLKIHTKKMRESQMMADDVDLDEIAALTKNFSGAELAGLVRGAQSCAIVRHIKVGEKVEIDRGAIDDIQVTRADFMYSLENDIKPAYGSKEEDFEKYIRNGILVWDPEIQSILDQGQLLINQVRKSTMTPVVSVLLTGQTSSGKTALAVRIALESGFPFIKICSPQDMIGYSEGAKCAQIKKVFADALKSEMSCIVVDDIVGLIDYNPIGNRYSNLVVQTLHQLLTSIPPKDKRLLIIATSNRVELLEMMEFTNIVGLHVHVPCLRSEVHVGNVLNEIKTTLNADEKAEIMSQVGEMVKDGYDFQVGIKDLIRIIGTSEQSEDGFRDMTFMEHLRRKARSQR